MEQSRSSGRNPPSARLVTPIVALSVVLNRPASRLRNAEALRAVASVATAAAYEINNPLTVALGEAQLLSKESDAKHGRLQHLIEALERIRDVVRTMNQITRLERTESLKNVPEMLDLRKSSSDAVDQGQP